MSLRVLIFVENLSDDNLHACLDKRYVLELWMPLFC